MSKTIGLFAVIAAALVAAWYFVFKKSGSTGGNVGTIIKTPAPAPNTRVSNLPVNRTTGNIGSSSIGSTAIKVGTSVGSKLITGWLSGDSSDSGGSENIEQDTTDNGDFTSYDTTPGWVNGDFASGIDF